MHVHEVGAGTCQGSKSEVTNRHGNRCNSARMRERRSGLDVWDIRPLLLDQDQQQGAGWRVAGGFMWIPFFTALEHSNAFCGKLQPPVVWSPGSISSMTFQHDMGFVHISNA